MYNEIPTNRPATPLLDSIDSPAELRALSEKQLPQLADELRAFLLYTVGQTGGHFGAGLGVVELTIALHYVYDTPEDRLVWDVGHQTYPHKILTSRRERMHSIRQGGGLSGFPKREESPYDTFGVGHSSTSISAAQGMAIGAKMAGTERKVAAIIGDGAMTAGMAFEALNHAAHTETDMLVVLNDNNMSISPNVGGLSTYLSKIWASKFYNSLREGSKQVLGKIPPAWEFARRTEEHFKGFMSPGTLFEEMGFNYVGPINGHDLGDLVRCLRNLREIKGPKLLHVITQKGKGFEPAELDPVGYHALNKIEPKKAAIGAVDAPKKVKFQDVFGQWLCDMAARDDKLIGITPAMCEGSGMVGFAQQFPERFYDVAIAEQHAVTLAAGMACEGQKPVVAIYSTFLQRAYDQLIHDVALQNLDVTFAIDRAGLVGEDGPTHSGSFDISYLRCIPQMLLATPSDENECRQLLYTAYQYPGPAAVRYPRGTGAGAVIEQAMTALPIGKGVVRREGKQVALLCFGTLLPTAAQVAEKLGASLCDMRFVKPLDSELIARMAASHSLLVTLEENALAGGAGSAVSEYLNSQGIAIPLLQLGFADEFIDHNSQKQQLAQQGLDAKGIETAITQHLAMMAAATKAVAG
ncbi:1-deoxy-D-xylulose-5-phosphate synthase [Cellvibrio japonicus]|uniref:1-deoxy-D-xylulose-5-phosphate synthase n=1 Tax=Cellvibrio japonicus (strain Ueda107) TaxID=498211 RepID=DXS_CELJU|nr:1-deoxy-D-xylulose-5-phosphate synthase [Cellvibrio japonicus]B3PF22.1 RecName: Full=1-deoxy-D-xylulose-5-phosphate synthase; AltName: Full=1-deoxyxylulose-5-phosphate synthase; Short=DXP synthase; Short=DXPS [Cellvibrio japonicus Ueda107]ACE82992.1 1-deoxy-D-xylulose-5-phosphate synthase [Cellvibrio japonicus Ueda107]QEI13581.1 1-deoxy-D-xylulose-5-phosphate synthase [Cellvibrio japonicus]QEI17155.1 1-deoxy-D-xylulose-5-phosphate synthase [Cellvibrio japonicus]QEI20732.1 1-deoxy-D-xylulose